MRTDAEQKQSRTAPQDTLKLKLKLNMYCTVRYGWRWKRWDALIPPAAGRGRRYSTLFPSPGKRRDPRQPRHMLGMFRHAPIARRWARRRRCTFSWEGLSQALSAGGSSRQRASSAASALLPLPPPLLPLALAGHLPLLSPSHVIGEGDRALLFA